MKPNEERERKKGGIDVQMIDERAEKIKKITHQK